MKKIAIITQHQVFNYGSVLQAYATQKIFEGHGVNVQVIDYISERWDNKKLFWNINKKGNCFYVLIYKILRIPIILKRKSQFWGFTKKYLNLTKRYIYYDDLVKNPPDADMYIVGSDQCWNSFYNGIDKAYFLQFGNKDVKRVSFATSVGNDFYNFDEEKQIKTYLKKFSNISVREKNSIKLIESITNKKVISLIDPTLQISKKEWEKLAKKRKLVKEKYLLLFLLYNEDLNASKYAKKIADSLNLKVVELSWQFKKNSLADILLTHKTPEEFLSLVRDADFIVTNSFHGLAFSLIFEKQFIVIKRSQFNNRISNLLDIVKLTERLVESSLDCSILNKKINYEEVEKIIEKEKNKANEYIIKILH